MPYRLSTELIAIFPWQAHALRRALERPGELRLGQKCFGADHGGRVARERGAGDGWGGRATADDLLYCIEPADCGAVSPAGP